MAQKRRFHFEKRTQVLMGSTEVIPVDVFITHQRHHLSSADTLTWWDAMFTGLPDWEDQRDADYERIASEYEHAYDPSLDEDVPF